jgi:hypothetical protein
MRIFHERQKEKEIGINNMKNTVYTILTICFCFLCISLIITSCSIFQKDKEEIEKVAEDIFEEAIKDETEILPSNAKTQKEEKKSA